MKTEKENKEEKDQRKDAVSGGVSRQYFGQFFGRFQEEYQIPEAKERRRRAIERYYAEVTRGAGNA